MKSSMAYKYEIVAAYFDDSNNDKVEVINKTYLHLDEALNRFNSLADVLKDCDVHGWFVTLYAIDGFKEIRMKLETIVEDV